MKLTLFALLVILFMKFFVYIIFKLYLKNQKLLKCKLVNYLNTENQKDIRKILFIISKDQNILFGKNFFFIYILMILPRLKLKRNTVINQFYILLVNMIDIINTFMVSFDYLEFIIVIH